MVGLTNYYIYNWVNNNQVVNKFEGYNYGWLWWTRIWWMHEKNIEDIFGDNDNNEFELGQGNQ